MLRLLIVDDSPTTRTLLEQVLESDPDIQVVGQAVDGAEALRLTETLRPDVITMDIQMPHVDGLEATHNIMSTAPTPIVIISASTVLDEVATAMKALRAGALTLIRKPVGPGSPSFESEARHLVEMVKAMADVKVVRRRPPQNVSSVCAPPTDPKSPYTSPGVVAIAASTGGPPAIAQVLSKLPADFPAPILMVQHIAAGFIEGLANWLDSVVQPTIKLARSGELLENGVVYIAPENSHLGVSAERTLDVSNLPPIDGYRPSANFLFRSVARSFGATAIAVILTGMGADGVDGLREIHRAGGLIIAQNGESCVVDGMPGSAATAGVVDIRLPPEAIGDELLRRSAVWGE